MIQHDGLMRITGKPDSNSEEEEAEERPECQLMQKKKRTSKGRAQTQDDQIEGELGVVHRCNASGLLRFDGFEV